MIEDKVYLNGELTDWKFAGIDIDSVLRGNYLYQTINTQDFMTIHLEEHLAQAEKSIEELYGLTVVLDAKDIRRQISGLLYYGLFPESGHTVNIYFMPDSKGKINTLVTHDNSTLYNGYALSDLKLKAVVANYDIPFEQHRTSVSLTAARFANDYARRQEANIALRANRAGNLVSADDFPIFAVKDDIVISPLTPRWSVELELMKQLCIKAGVELKEEDIPTAKLHEYKELIIFNSIGLQSVISCGEVYFYNLTAKLLEKHLPQLTEEGVRDR